MKQLLNIIAVIMLSLLVIGLLSLNGKLLAVDAVLILFWFFTLLATYKPAE